MCLEINDIRIPTDFRVLSRRPVCGGRRTRSCSFIIIVRVREIQTALDPRWEVVAGVVLDRDGEVEEGIRSSSYRARGGCVG